MESLEHILQGRTIPAPYDGNDDEDDDGENVVPGIEGHTDVVFVWRCLVEWEKTERERISSGFPESWRL